MLKSPVMRKSCGEVDMEEIRICQFESHQETERMMQYLEILQMKKEDDKC